MTTQCDKMIKVTKLGRETKVLVLQSGWGNFMFSISFRENVLYGTKLIGTGIWFCENVLDGTRHVREYTWFHLKRLIGTKCSDEIERWRG